MKDPRSRLDRIDVTSPCTVDWERMVGNDRVRFCEHCARSVHDLSSMTRFEAERFVRGAHGRICVRYVRSADGRIRTAEPPPPIVPLVRRRAPQIAAGAAALVLGIAGVPPAFAGEPAAQVVASAPAASERPGGAGSVSGLALDPQGAVIAGASVSVIGGGETRTATTDGDGRYEIGGLSAGTYAIVFAAPGFSTQGPERLEIAEGQALTFDKELDLGEVTAMGGAMVIESHTQPLVWHMAERDAVAEKSGAEPETPALLQLYYDDSDAFKKAAADGANVNERFAFGDTLLAHLVGDDEVVEALIAAGADVDAADQFGVTPLMHAALYDEGATIRRLVRAGASVDAADANGLTALMIAAMDDNADSVEALLIAGANHRLRDVHGKTALDYAREEEQEEIVEILESAGAR